MINIIGPCRRFAAQTQSFLVYIIILSSCINPWKGSKKVQMDEMENRGNHKEEKQGGFLRIELVYIETFQNHTTYCIVALNLFCLIFGIRSLFFFLIYLFIVIALPTFDHCNSCSYTNQSMMEKSNVRSIFIMSNVFE